MPYAQSDRARLYYEECGSGYPIVFVHEFSADLREWESQVRWFSRSYRCIRFNARGYPPSDVPEENDAYGQAHAADDIAAVMAAAGIRRAHIVGLSMGASATLHFGLRHPEMASALVVVAGGSGAAREGREAFRRQAESLAERMMQEGFGKIAGELGVGPTRVQLQIKDPLGWAEFVAHLREHSPSGSALTLRNYQALRPSLYDLKEELAAVRIPTLLVVGDEDEPCLAPNFFLKQTMPAARLWVVPNTGHAVNLEEPAAFNAALDQFLASVDRGAWKPRDPRTLKAGLLSGASDGKN